MGSACSCYVSYKQSDLLKQELGSKPFNSTLTGNSPSEEPFLEYNISFHLTNFSDLIRKSKSQSVFTSLPIPSPQSDKLRIYHQSPSKSSPSTDSLLIEGELDKYRADSSPNYVPRWCKLTTHSFSYYKTKWSTFLNPMFQIPACMICEVKVIENRIQKNNPELFEFELILFGDEEGSSKKSKNTTREISLMSSGIIDEELLSGRKKLVFGTKDLQAFQLWVRGFKDVTGF